MLELQQERKQAVVLVHAAVCDDDIQRPVHLRDATRERDETGVRRNSTWSFECEGKLRETELRKTGKGRVMDDVRGEEERCEYRDVDRRGERIVKTEW